MGNRRGIEGSQSELGNEQLELAVRVACRAAQRCDIVKAIQGNVLDERRIVSRIRFEGKYVAESSCPSHRMPAKTSAHINTKPTSDCDAIEANAECRAGK